jgi:hypothetical protein
MAFATIIAFSGRAHAVELLVNGGFEENMVNWTLVDDHPNVAYAYGVGAGRNLYDGVNALSSRDYLHNSFAQEGSRTCMIPLTGIGQTFVTARIYQDVAVPPNTSLTISWKQRFSQMNMGNPTTLNSRLRVYIRRPSDDAILQTLHATDLLAQLNEVKPWETQSINLGTNYAGQNIRLDFNARIPDNSPSNGQTLGLWELDAVSANAVAPTAAAVSLSGRVKTADGKALSKAKIILADMDGNVRTVLTNGFGFYKFEDVQAGSSYILVATYKNAVFSNVPRFITLEDDLQNEDFIAPSGTGLAAASPTLNQKQ